MSADDMRRALEAERDAALKAVARLAAERAALQLERGLMLQRIRELAAEAAQLRATAGALTPERIGA